MEIRSFSELGEDAWDAFCHQSDQAWFWHTSSFLFYSLEHRPDLRPANYSFGVIDNGKIVAVCPLILEKIPAADGIPEHREFSFAGTYGPQPAFGSDVAESVLRRTQAATFQQVERLAKSNAVARASMRAVPIAELMANRAPDNLLQRFGYLDNSISTQMIDLRRDADAIFRDFTKGHRSDVRRAGDQVDVEVFAAANIDEGTFHAYKELHHEAAGRSTRPASTFKKMHEWIKSGLAVLAGAKKDGQFVGFSLLFTFGRGAYYASACNKPGMRNMPISHALQWKTILWLQEHGFSHYELGWHQHEPSLSEIPTEKETNIMKFKRGFGGSSIPFFRGEYFFDGALFRSVMKHRVDRYADQLD